MERCATPPSNWPTSAVSSPARDDRILGFRLDLLDIADPQVIAVSGQAQHPILVPTGDPTDSIAGSVLDLTDDDLRRADAYEVDDYRRVEASLASGDNAWVYVAAVHAAP